MLEKLNDIYELMSSNDYIANFTTSWNEWWNTYIPNYVSYELWMFSSLFVFGGILLVFFLTRLHKYAYGLIVRNLSCLSFVVWVLGIAIYTIGMTDKELNVWSVLPRVIIASFKMFAVTNELARVDSRLHHDAIYMTAFSLIHFFAACITFVFVFKMIGYKMKCTIALALHKHFVILCKCLGRKRKNVHLFWGVNEASLLLAEDMYNNEADTNNDTFIFIDVDKECDNDCQKKPSISFLTNTITITDSEMSRLDKIGALVDHCYNGPASVDVTNNSDSKDIFDALRLNTVSKILQQSENLNIYLLSDDESYNISAALNLRKDRNLTNLKKLPTIFVHARRGAYNEVFAHYSQYYTGAESSKKMKIKVVDSAYLSIQSLKTDDNALPVNCVNVNPTTGTVDEPFTAMIVGFSSTGQEAFKFLYEFSAFIDSNKKKSPFKCYVFDEKMDKIEGLVRAKMPAITFDELELIQTSVDTECFWNKVDEIINKLNYIVIALNNDVLGMSLAVNLFKYAMKKRDCNKQMLKIMVRCYDRSNQSRMKEVEKLLNKSASGIRVEIKLFATSRELFTYKNVVSNETLDEAKEYHYVYENLQKPEEERWNLTQEEQWKNSFVETKDDNGNIVCVIDKTMKKRSISRYHAIYEINRQISQNFSNSLHRTTKLILMGIDKNSMNDRLKLFEKYRKTRVPKTIEYHCNKKDADLLNNIALVEHERWIAAHKLMGYTWASSTDYVKKHHQCMCDFDKLNEETQSYDYNVVDTTIKMTFQELNKKSSN